MTFWDSPKVNPGLFRGMDSTANSTELSGKPDIGITQTAGPQQAAFDGQAAAATNGITMEAAAK